jgi:CheY-like chemotaxis protein
MKPSQAPKPKICFLIEDDSDDREIFQLALNALDIPTELVTAGSGVIALERIHEDASFTPDYIFLDLNMPYMSGKDCLIKLRQIARLKNTSITLFSTVKYNNELAEYHLTEFLTKPNSIEGIRNILARVIV